MRRIFLGPLAASALLFTTGFASGQINTIDALDRELKQVQQKHQEDTNKILSAFFAQVDAAMVSSDAAIKIYTDPAGINGTLPPAAPVATVNEHESESEKALRVSIDDANLARLGAALQLHCGLLHYGGLFVLEPNRPGLQAAWVNWLKTAVPIYLQIAPPHDRSSSTGQPDANQNDRGGDRQNRRDRRNRPDKQSANPSTYVPDEVKGKSLRDSLFTKYNGYHGFNDKDQGNWSVRDIPRLYRTNILDPLRVHPTAATLAAWDNVIDMADADEPNADRWNNEVSPSLQFDRACDAYLVAPNTESLEALVNFIRQNPTYPKLDDWISRVRQYVTDYRSNHTRPAPAPTLAPSAPVAPTSGVTVTTQQQGDMTIVTTHSNGAPQNPTPPPQ